MEPRNAGLKRTTFLVLNDNSNFKVPLPPQFLGDRMRRFYNELSSDVKGFSPYRIARNAHPEI